MKKLILIIFCIVAVNTMASCLIEFYNPNLGEYDSFLRSGDEGNDIEKCIRLSNGGLDMTKLIDKYEVGSTRVQNYCIAQVQMCYWQ